MSTVSVPNGKSKSGNSSSWATGRSIGLPVAQLLL